MPASFLSAERRCALPACLAAVSLAAALPLLASPPALGATGSDSDPGQVVGNLGYSLAHEEVPEYFRVQSLLLHVHARYESGGEVRSHLLSELGIEPGGLRQLWLGNLVDAIARQAYGATGPETRFRHGGSTVIHRRPPGSPPSTVPEEERARAVAQLYFELQTGLDEEGQEGLARLQRLVTDHTRLSSDEPFEGRANPYWETFDVELERLQSGAAKESD